MNKLHNELSAKTRIEKFFCNQDFLYYSKTKALFWWFDSTKKSKSRSFALTIATTNQEILT